MNANANSTIPNTRFVTCSSCHTISQGGKENTTVLQNSGHLKAESISAHKMEETFVFMSTKVPKH